MLYRRFGKTNLLLSVFSLGTMHCLESGSNVEATLIEALNQGINHLETARGYGKSEVYLGQVLKKIPALREKFYITTKLIPTPDTGQMRSWIEQSLARLNLDYIDCLAIHGINTWEHLSWLQNSQGCMVAITEAVAEGKIRHVGFSTHAPLDVILATINTNFFQFINLHYYYFWQRNEPAIALASQKDMGVFIISPADKGGRLYTPSAKLAQLCHPLSPLEFNYRFLLGDSRISTLSVGAATPQELSLPLKVANQGDALTAQELAIKQRLEKELQLQLATDKCSQCYQCLPCPEQINIPEILRLRNLALAYQMQDFAEYRYGMFENAGHWFPGTKGNRCSDCGDCLPRCPEKLNIPHLVRDAHQRFNGKPRRRLWDM